MLSKVSLSSNSSLVMEGERTSMIRHPPRPKKENHYPANDPDSPHLPAPPWEEIGSLALQLISGESDLTHL